MNLVRINGEDASAIAADSRGLAYGDGVFRTLLAIDGHIVDADTQLQKLAADAARLALDAPDAARLLRDSTELLVRSGLSRAVLKWLLVRRSEQRGYRSTGSAADHLVLLNAAPRYRPDLWTQGAVADLAPFRLALQPQLAGIKHLNRLEQVLASRDWPEGIDERLLCDTEGMLVGGTRSNLFWVRGDRLYTPCVDRCGIAGVMRARVLDAAATLGIVCVETLAPVAELQAADEVFVCNALLGLWPLRRIGAVVYAVPGSITARLQVALAHPRLD